MPDLLADVQLLFADRPAAPQAKQVDKRHGRVEVRTIRVASDLAGYSTWPGLAQVAEVLSRVTVLSTGEVRYLVTSLTAAQADPARLLTLSRKPWHIENTGFHVRDDSFGEARHVLQSHQRGLVVSLLRGTAHNLLCGACLLWAVRGACAARAEWISSRPLTILAQL